MLRQLNILAVFILTGLFLFVGSVSAQMTFTSMPTANSPSVGVTSNIELDFSADVNLGTVHSNTTNTDDVFDDNIKIIGSQSGQFRGVFSVGADNSIVIFNPSINFKAGEKVTVIVNALVMSTGAQPATASSFSFLAQAGPFEGKYKERPTAGIAGMADGAFDWGDYDNDGDLDLIVVGFDPSFNSEATIYNNVNGTFTDIGAGLTGVFFSTAEWGDYDGDGDLDVVVAGSDDTGTFRLTTIYQNNGGVFTDIVAGLQGVDYAALDWGDFDNDGDLDLVVMGRYQFSPDLVSSIIYRNDGGGVFTDIAAGLQPLNNGSVDWGDYDADGDLDLIMTGFDADWVNRFTIIYDNNGGVFTDHLAGLPQVAWGDTDWGDYDNDGDLDLLLSGDAAGPTFTSIFNNTGGVFTDIGAGFPTTSEGSVRWGDYDGDGNLDVVLTGNDYSTGTQITNIFKNNGGGVFTDINAGLSITYFTGLAEWADFDGDGDLDILVAGEANTPSSTSAVLYENTIFNPFITTWKTDNPGSSTDTQISIPTNGAGYDYDIVWTEVGVPSNTGTLTSVTGPVTIDFPSAGTYRIEITGHFPRIYFNAGGFFGANNDHEKILTVESWGSIDWTSMSRAFSGCENLRINAVDAPDLSGVTDMSQMFYEATSLNDDINHWSVSSVENMSALFKGAESFDQPLDLWAVDNVTNTSEMFEEATVFNQDLNSWNVDNVTNMSSMFERATTFNQNLNSWNVDNVTNMFSMFNGAIAFNGNITSWRVNKVTSFRFMFLGATSFNQDISTWQLNAVSNINLSGMFSDAIAFNQDISFKPGGGNNGGDAWNTIMVTDMSLLFRRAIAFTQPITNWAVNVGNVTNMREMFGDNSTFNQDISSWDVSKVTNMENMFESATAFNQDISGWDVSTVNDMSEMFSNATAFNQDLGRAGGWDVSGVSDMRLMFENASAFDQDLSGWDVSNLNQAVSMFNNSGLSVSNYDKLLEGWAAQTLRSNVSFGAFGIFYCSAQSARDVLTTTFNWNITDGGTKCITIYDGPDTTAPEITNAQPQAIDFGSTSTTKTRTFTLLNNQDTPITNVQINNPASGFPTVTVFASIAAGATQTFTIDLTGPIGTYTETVTITSSDFSGSFLFDVTGEVTATPEPEIAVFEGPDILGTPILNGQLTPLDLGYEIKGNSLMGEFTITNIGDTDLNISDITFSGSDFLLGSIPPAVISVNGTETIQVILTGATAGVFSETISILNDDSDEAIFNFNVYGEILGPDIAVYNGTDIYSDPEIFDGQVAPVDFGSGPDGVDIVLPITIANWNPVDLNISNVTITGSAFTLTSTPPTFVAAEVDAIISYVTFDIMLSGATAGTFTETVTILSDDEDTPSLSFTLTGTILATGCASPPTAAIGVIADICEGSTIALTGSIGGSASTSTWSTAGDGNFNNASLLNAIYTPGPTDISNGTVNLSLSTDDPDGAGPCNAASALAFVTIGRSATVNAGIDQTICTTDIATLTGTIGQAANNPSWGTSGSGIFSSPNALSSDYTPSAADISAGSVTLTLTADATGVCPQAVDQLILTISQPITAGSPTVASNVNQATNIDIIGTSTINTGDVITVTILQNPTKGTLVTNTDNSIDYTAPTGTIGADSFEYEICNQCGLCSNATVAIDILNEAPVITPPSSAITSRIGESVTIPFNSFISDPNNNIDLNSIQVIAGPLSNAPTFFDGDFNFTIDYTNIPFGGTDEVTIQVCDLSGACSQIVLQIEVEGEIIAFNGISPNDDGKNDHFVIQNIQFLEPENKVSIYNRWGDLIFDIDNYDSLNPDKRFNGISNKNKEVTSGVYFYKAEFTSGRKSLTGYLTIKQ